MTTTTTATAPPVAPIALQPGEGDARWFLDALGTIKAAPETTNGQVAVLEFRWPEGSGSPLHVHHDEDEWFYVIEGELTLWVGGDVVVAPAGSFVYGPRDIPHTFVVTSSGEARFLMVTHPAPFADFVRTLSSPAEALTLPPASAEVPTPEHMTAVAAEYGMDILGPPGIPS
jgi:quercetin dioxygenase-like cupin family protein